MKKIRAILVDDEESARDILENLLKRFCPEVCLLDKCANLEKAVESINLYKPDLVFLDIEMPNYAGFEIVKFFEEINFEIVFVTAYDKYALRAFEVAAVDYLLKPIDIDRLKSAVQRVVRSVDLKQSVDRLSVLKETLSDNVLRNITLSDKGFQFIVAIADIIAIEAQEAYTKVYTRDRKFTVSKNLKHFERIFEDTPTMIRVHKSWLINKNFIVNYSKTDLQINLGNDIIAKLSKYKINTFENAMAN